MSEEIVDKADKKDNSKHIHYKVTQEAKNGLDNFADKYGILKQVALEHILLQAGRNIDLIDPPTRYSAKFELGNDGSTVTIATCGVCQEAFSPALHGSNIEHLLQWANDHKEKHSKGQ